MKNITQVIKGCIDKDHKCQKIIYEHYFGFALKIVFRYIYRYEKARDVVNDGFAKMFNHFKKFKLSSDTDNEKILMAWLKTIMINASIDKLRTEDMLPEIGGIPEEVWEQSDNSQDADQLVLYKELMLLLKGLPPAWRAVFNLYVIDGYSHVEIAAFLKISVGTSKSNLARARSRLQLKIRKMENVSSCRI